MRKVFISTMPMQTVNICQYTSQVYPESSETGFPITISFENNCQQGETLTVLTIITCTEGVAGKNNAEGNYYNFKEQIKKIADEHGAEVQFEEIYISSQITNSSPRELYLLLTDKLRTGDTIFVDITYGFKYNAIAVFSALNRAYQLLSEVEIEEICYGSYYIGEKEAKFEYFDMTSLFYLNSLNSLDGMCGIELDVADRLDK